MHRLTSSFRTISWSQLVNVRLTRSSDYNRRKQLAMTHLPDWFALPGCWSLSHASKSAQIQFTCRLLVYTSRI